MTYADKLQDERWKERRRQILNRDRNTCQHCYSTQPSLHVHHRYYKAGKEPWEYDDSVLVTLCADCHEIETLLYKRYKRSVINLKAIGFPDGFVCVACGYGEYKIKGTDIICNLCGWENEFSRANDLM